MPTRLEFYTKTKQPAANSSALQLYIIDVTSKAATARANAAIVPLVTVLAACRLVETGEAGSKEGKDGGKTFSQTMT